MTSWWARLSRRGTAGLGAEEGRKVRLLNQCAVLAIGSLAMFTVGYLIDVPRFGGILLVNVVAMALQGAVLWLVARGHRRAALGLFLLANNGQMAIAVQYFGPQVGFHHYYFAFAAVVFLVTPKRDRFFWPFALVSLVLYLYAILGMSHDDALIHVDSMFAMLVRVVCVITTFGTLVLIGVLADSDTREAEEGMAREHERSESLLLNILPPSISSRLKSGDKSIADGFGEVSVVFADIVGFTELSARLPPDRLVEVLNKVFSRFDDLADELGLEKIKTIGDAYMVAAGLPEPCDDHAARAVRMALRMRDALEDLNQKDHLGLSIRIGVHSGPVVAGVIGKKKFIYDLWGDTVNTASRMESHGVKGSVHVSDATAGLLGAGFELEARGAIQVKGKGEMTTFFVRGLVA